MKTIRVYFAPLDCAFQVERGIRHFMDGYHILAKDSDGKILDYRRGVLLFDAPPNSPEVMPFDFSEDDLKPFEITAPGDAGRKWCVPAASVNQAMAQNN